MLNSSDSFISTNITRYSFKDKNYKLETNTPQTRIHFDMNSKSVPRDSVAEQPGEGEAVCNFFKFMFYISQFFILLYTGCSTRQSCFT